MVLNKRIGQLRVDVLRYHQIFLPKHNDNNFINLSLTIFCLFSMINKISERDDLVNYDRIILELLGRVQTLEEQISEIKAELLSKEDGIDELGVENELGGFTRSQARERVIKIIEAEFPDYVVDKASRKEGSGIKIHKPDSKRPTIIKFYHSKSFGHRSGGYEHGWHVVRLNDVIGTVIDLCMFSLVDSSGNWNFLIYDPDEIGMYNEENRSGSNDILHLYFVVKDGKATEVRENTVDVTDHLNNWEALK